MASLSVRRHSGHPMISRETGSRRGRAMRPDTAQTKPADPPPQRDNAVWLSSKGTARGGVRFTRIHPMMAVLNLPEPHPTALNLPEPHPTALPPPAVGSRRHGATPCPEYFPGGPR